MTQALIRRGLETALKTYADANSLTVAWENVEFTQPDGAYLRAFVLPGDTFSDDLGRVGRTYAGIFQVSVVCPTGTGPGAAEAIVAGIAAAFPPASPITVSTLTLWITQPLSQAAAIQERDRFVIPCSLPYSATVY